MDVIQSDSELALHNSLNQLRGDIKVEVEKMREVLLTDIAFVEAALDDRNICHWMGMWIQYWTCQTTVGTGRTFIEK